MKTNIIHMKNRRILNGRNLPSANEEAGAPLSARVVQVGPLFALATVLGEPSLGKVRVDHRLIVGREPMRVGDRLMLGPVEYLPAGPRALSARRSQSRCATTHSAACRAKRAIPGRSRGSITRVAKTGRFGQITELPTGRQYFVHSSQLQPGTILQLDSPVSFTPAKTPRGLVALEVRSICE